MEVAPDFGSDGSSEPGMNLLVVNALLAGDRLLVKTPWVLLLSTSKYCVHWGL